MNCEWGVLKGETSDPVRLTLRRRNKSVLPISNSLLCQMSKWVELATLRWNRYIESANWKGLLMTYGKLLVILWNGKCKNSIDAFWEIWKMIYLNGIRTVRNFLCKNRLWKCFLRYKLHYHYSPPSSFQKSELFTKSYIKHT